MQAWANSARYTPADQMLVLTGNPRVANGGMATTAKTIRINRATGDALAQGDVKSTYSELKEQPNGALLASSSPIHVTARSMTAHNARRTGPLLGQRSPLAGRQHHRGAHHPVRPRPPVRDRSGHPHRAGADDSGSKGKTSRKGSPAAGKRGADRRPRLASRVPSAITAAKLTYADSERKVHYEGGVIAKGADFTATAKTADAYLLPRSQTSANQSLAGPGQLDRMVAAGRRRRPTAQPPGRGSKPGLHRGRRQVRPHREDRPAFLMPNRARLPGFR